MTNFTVAPLALFPSGSAPRLAFPEWRSSVFSQALRYSHQDHGLAGYLMTPAAYDLKFPADPFVPAAHPGPEPAVAAAFYAALLTSIAGPASRIVAPDGDTSNVTLAQAWTLLEDHYGMLTVDLEHPIPSAIAAMVFP